jgi:tetratricopeptide (TPR) repeat protein
MDRESRVDGSSRGAALGASVIAVVALAFAGWRLVTTRVTPAATPQTPAQLILALESAAAADANPREAYEGLGAACLRMGHLLSARAAFREAERRGSSGPWLRQQLAWCALRLDRRDEALAEYRRLLQDEGGTPAAYLRLAGAALRMGETESAQEVLRSLPKGVRQRLETGSTSEERTQRARYLALLHEAGLTRECRVLAKSSVARFPEEASGRIALARAAARLGPPAAALRAIDAALVVEPQAAELHALRGDALTALMAPPEQITQAYREAVTARPNLGPAHYRLGQLALAGGRAAEARQAFLRARSLGTEPVASLRGAAQASEKAGQPLAAAMDWGAYYDAVGNLDGARKAYRELLDQPQGRLAATLRLADLDARNQRLRDAIARLEAARQEAPEAVELCRDLARAYRAFGRPRDATALWKRVARMDAALAPDAFRELAGIAEALGDFDDAERHYAEAIRLRPQDGSFHRLLGTLLLLRRSQGDRLARAIDALERSVALEPEESAAFLSLGRAYEAAGRDAEALLALRHAIDLAPGAGPPYLHLGRLARRMGRGEESREMLAMYRLYHVAQRETESLKAKVAARPRDPLVRLEIAEYYARARDYSRAATEYERCLAMGATLLPVEQRRTIRTRLAYAYERLARREDAATQRALAARL